MFWRVSPYGSSEVFWEKGLDYKHGTGHGVGYLLNVHEGPHGFSSEVPLREGMVVTIEPGVYTEGSHGIRIENSVFVQEEEKNEFGQFLSFETVTFLPYEKKAIVVSELTADEINWINAYHQAVYEKLSPMLNDEERAWLKDKTEAIA